MSIISERLSTSRKQLTPRQPNFCVAWEDPSEIESPIKISYPAPEWLAAAMAGRILPCIESIIHDKITGEKTAHSSLAAGPMTEEEAMEYFSIFVLPLSVLHHKGNKPSFIFMRCSDIPKDRTFRNAWEVKHEQI